MQCDQLQQRVDELLDRRAEPRADADVAAHLADCPACRRLVGGYEAMLLGLDILAGADPAGRVVANHVAWPGRPRRTIAGRRLGLAALATALAVAIAFAPAWFVSPPVNSPAAAERQASDSTAGQAAALSLPAVDEPYADAMGRAMQLTGRSLAYFPETLPKTVRRVASYPGTDVIVGPIRPLASPVGAAWEVILRTWHGPQSGTEIPEADTSFVHWRAKQYA